MGQALTAQRDGSTPRHDTELPSPSPRSVLPLVMPPASVPQNV